MEITAEWAAVVLSAIGMGGAGGAWVQGRIHSARQAMPIIRAEWVTGSRGHGLTITIVNRLSEDITVEKIAVATTFNVDNPRYDDGGSIVEARSETKPSPITLNWVIEPAGQRSGKFRIDGADTERLAFVTISSSARTLRSKRFAIRDSHKP